MSRQDEYNLATDTAFGQRVVSSLLAYIRGTVLAEAAYDLQTVSVSGTPTGGTFTLSGGPLTGTVTVPFNATAQAVQALVNAALASGNSCVTQGGPLPGTGVQVIWVGNLTQQAQNLMTISANSLTGGSTPNAAVAHTVVGVSSLAHALRVAFAAKVLLSPESYVYIARMVAVDVTVQSDYTSGGKVSTAVTDAHLDAAIAAQFNMYSGAY